MRLLTIFLTAAVTLSACSDNTAILVPDATQMPAGARELALVRNGAITAAAGFSFAPPIAQRPPIHNGPFDGALSPSVTVCELNSVDACQTTVATFTTAGSGEERVRVDLEDELYQVNWSTRDLISGKSYRVRVLLWAMEIGSADFRLVANGAGLHSVDSRYVGAVTGSTVPVKFRIEEAVLWDGLAPLTLSRTSAAPGGALELGGVGTSADTKVSIGNAPAVVRDGGRGTLLTFAPVFLGAGRWPVPPSGPQHVIVLRNGIPIAGARAALTITPLQKAPGSSQTALHALTSIAARFGELSTRLPIAGTANAAYLQAINGAFAELVGGSDPRSLATHLQRLANTDPASLELLDALLASSGLTGALQQYATLMTGLSIPSSSSSMMFARPEAAVSQNAKRGSLTGVGTMNAEVAPTPTNVTAVRLAELMQFYAVVRLFSETVVSGTNSTWANYIAAGAGLLGVLGAQVPAVAWVGAALAIADFVANKVIVGQLPAKLSTFTLEIVETQLHLDEETISVVTAVGANDPPTMGVQDVTNLFLSVVGAFTPIDLTTCEQGNVILCHAEQSATDIASFFLGFLQNLLTVLSSQHPELNLDAIRLSGPRWAWRAVVTDPRFVDRKTQTPSIITGISDAVNWRASAVNRGEGRVFAQTALGPDAMVLSLPAGFYYTGGAFGENVEITNKVDVVVGGRVTVSPDPVTVAPHGTQQFTAAVLGVSNTAVTWTTSDPGGIVSASGMYTAGPNSGVFSVTATSVEDPASSDVAQVNVVAPPASTGKLVLTRVDGSDQAEVIPLTGARCTQSHLFPTTTPPAASITLPTAQCQPAGGSAVASHQYSSVETSGGLAMFAASGQAATSSGEPWTLSAGQTHAFYDFEVSGGDVSVTLSGQLNASIGDLSSNTDARAMFVLFERSGGPRLVDKLVGRNGGSDEMVPPTALSGTYVLRPGRYRINVFAEGNSMALMEDVEGVPTLRVAGGSSSFTFTLRVQ